MKESAYNGLTNMILLNTQVHPLQNKSKVAVIQTLYFDFSFYSMSSKNILLHFELLDFDPWLKN